MKKEDFEKLGVESELAEKAANASAEELSGYIPKTRFDEVNDAKKNAEAEVKKRDKQIADLQKSAEGNDDLKSRLQKLQDDNKASAQKYEAQIRELKISNAVDAALTAAHAKNKTAVKALLEGLDKAEILGDGTVKGLADQVEKLAKAEDTSFLFEQETKPTIQGATPGQPSDPSSTGVTKEQFEKMSYTERNDLYQNDRALYDQLISETK